MILGVISDTHGNLAMMQDVATALTQEHGAELILHLGDDYADALALRDAGFPVRMAPGLWCPEYRNPRVPKLIMETFEGVTIACCHADQDLRGPARQAAIIAMGHTHTAEIRRVGRTVFFNPGHLKAAAHRGRPASYGLIQIDADQIILAIFGLDGRVRLEENYLKSDLGA
ncbi:MAG TPA: hypothetical protein ENN65_01885 [Candidatus Hydrogenedentes bacterium]|nr:hypothetical protein [Candidatus Hydrogenedentota bacterium]